MALALYRTYRPGTLAEVIGQGHVVEPLTRALAAGRTHHAYLLSGPRGCGKTSTARILARSLNCVDGPTAQPCGECRSCVELAPNGPGSMDVVELDAATHRGIDDARELREKAVYAPASSRFKVYIIDEAHQLTNEAANALLKLVEEPPPHLRFIFATTEPDKIIPTIRSRTFHYGFRLVPARILADHLAGVCESEGVPAEPAALAVVARAGAGSVRDSLSVLGQLLAGSGPRGLTYAEAVAALGLTDAGLIDGFVAALAAGSAAEMFGVVDSVIGAGHDPRRFVTDVLDRLRDLIVLRVDPDALSSGLVDVPEEDGERLAGQAEQLSLAELSRAADLVSAGLGQIKGATAPRLQLELLCARLALPEIGLDPAAVLARLERLERSGTPSGSVLEAGPAGAASEPPGGADTGPAAPGAAAPRAGAPGPAASVAATRGPVRSGPPQRPDLRRRADTTPREAVSARPEPAPLGSAGARADRPKAPAQAPGSEASQAPAPSPATPQPSPSAAPAPARVSSPPTTDSVSAPTGPSRGPASAATTTSELARVRESWPAIMDRLAASSRVAWTAFHAATPVSCAGGALAVAVSESGYARAIAQRGHDERLRQAIIDVLSLDVTIDVLHDPEPARTSGAPTGGPDRGSADPEHGPSQEPAGGATVGRGAAAPPRGDLPPGGRPATTRPGDLVRTAGGRGGQAESPDEPSPDDPDLEAGASGLELITRELGARPIGEIDHS